MMRLDIRELEEPEDQNTHRNVWSELIMDESHKEEHTNGRGRQPEIYDPYTWDNNRTQPAYQQPIRYTTSQQPQPTPSMNPVLNVYDEMLLKYNVQIVNGKMRYVDPMRGITVPKSQPATKVSPPISKAQQNPKAQQNLKSENAQCTTKVCPFKKQIATARATPGPTQRPGNMFGNRVQGMPARSKKLIM